MHVGGEDQCTGSDRRLLIAALTDAGRLLDSLVASNGSCTSHLTHDRCAAST